MIKRDSVLGEALPDVITFLALVNLKQRSQGPDRKFRILSVTVVVRR